MIKANKDILTERLFDLMRLIYVVFPLLLALMTFAQCQPTAEDWHNKGIALDNQGKYDEAIQAYDEAIRLDPNEGLAWYNGLHPSEWTMS